MSGTSANPSRIHAIFGVYFQDCKTSHCTTRTSCSTSTSATCAAVSSVRTVRTTTALRPSPLRSPCSSLCSRLSLDSTSRSVFWEMTRCGVNTSTGDAVETYFYIVLILWILTITVLSEGQMTCYFAKGNSEYPMMRNQQWTKFGTNRV